MPQFQVDLRGIVEILSRNLYSSPRVFVRELLQNAVDAITVRRQHDPGAPGAVTIEARPDGSVSFTDTGIGLTAAEVEQLLATIGHSSKRDELNFQREGLLGQFGIGLLSCFLVSDEIEVRTRSAASTDAPTVRWIGRGDGTYDLADASEPLPVPGTVVTLRPRRGDQWLEPAMLRELATYYGSLLPMPVTMAEPTGAYWTIAPQLPAWELPPESSSAFCLQAFGFVPLATIPLHVELTGVRGVAYVLPTRANPTEASRHRVYLRRMMLSESVQGLLPDWAYFVRAVVDVEGLSPTVSREALYEDETLAATREALGSQIREWMLRAAATDPQLLHQFIAIHDLGVKSIALYDDDMLQVVRDWAPWQTTAGELTMAELVRLGPRIDYVPTTGEYTSIASIAEAQRFVVVNAGHTYDVELLERFAAADPGIELHPVGAAEVAGRLYPADSDAGLQRLAQLGTVALDQQRCDVTVRAFEPPATPALYVPDPDRDEREVDRDARAAAEASPLFAGLLDADDAAPEPVHRALLVLNATNPVIRSLPGLDEPLAAEVLRGLYSVAMLAGRHRMDDADRALLTAAFLSLIERVR